MPRRRQLGSGRLEFAVVAVVMALLAWFWIRAVTDVQIEAEKAVVGVHVRHMQTGLQFKVTELIVAGRTGEIAGLIGQNPVQWLPQPPQNYLGELEKPPAGSAPKTWYFDRRSRQLIYVPGARDLLGEGGREHLAWHVEAGAGGREGGLMGVRIVQIP